MLHSIDNSLKDPRRRLVLLALIAAILLLLAAAAWWFLLPRGGQQPEAATTYPPLTSDIQPADGAIIRGAEVWVSWQPLVQAKGRVLWRAAGESAFQTVDATGYPLAAHLSALKEGARYEYIAEDTVGQQTERSTLRTFTVEGGLAFDSPVVEQSVNRDYYQPVTLMLHNNSKDKVVVGAKALVHFDDLPADVVGPGSVDEPVEVPPGGSLPLDLAVTAPDARQSTYDIPVEAAGAYALARVRISGLNFKVAFKVVSQDPHTLAKTIDIQNEGDSLADLAVTTAAANQNDVRIQPSVTHGYLPSGQTLEIVVAPVLYLEFQSLSAQLQVSAGGQTANFPLDFKAPAGQQLMGLRTDPDERSVSRDWYCTNKPDTCSNVAGPDGSGPADQTSGSGDSEDSLVAAVALLNVPGASSPHAGPSAGPPPLQGTCSSCNTNQACKDIAALQQLINEYNGSKGDYVGSFASFVLEFSTTLNHLTNTDLACAFDPGSGRSQVASLLGDILGKVHLFKSLTPSAMFPDKAHCDKNINPNDHSPECEDVQTIDGINNDLNQLAGILGCPQANPTPTPTVEPSGICPPGEEKKSSDTDKALEPIIDGFKKALEQIDEELRLSPGSEALREKWERLQKVKELLEHIKAGSCVPSDVIQTLNALSQGRSDDCPNFCNALFNWLEKMGLAKDSDRNTFLPGCATACDEAVPPAGGGSSVQFVEAQMEPAQASGTTTQVPAQVPAIGPQMRLGLLEAMQRRASFTRAQRGPLAAPAEGNASDSSSLAAAWYTGSSVYFVWHQNQDEVLFAALDPAGKTLVAPDVIGWGSWPRLVADGNRIAAWYSRPSGQYGRLYDGKQWGLEFDLSGTDASLAFAPGGPLYAATSTGLWKLGDNSFESVRQTTYAQPALAIDSQGKPQVVYQRSGHIIAGSSDLGEGERPTITFGSDGTLYLAYLANESLVVRQLHGGAWTAPDPIPARNASWPTLSTATDGVRLSYLGPADYGPDALWLVRLPNKTSVLVPSLWGNVSEASLMVHFDLRGPRSDYRPHNVQVMVNDVVVGIFTDTVPEGRYIFTLDPNQVFTSNGQAATNRVSISSQHMNPGHYAVNSDYELIIRTGWMEQYGFGSSASEIINAKTSTLIDHNQPDLAVLANSLNLPVEMPTPGPINMTVTVANLGEGSSQPARLQMLDGERALAEAAVPALDAGRQMTVTLPLAYDSKLESVTLHIQQSQPDFDPTNDDLTIHLWAPKITSSAQIGPTQTPVLETQTPVPMVMPTAAVSGSGIKMENAGWVPQFRSYGGWTAVRSGEKPNRSSNWTTSASLPLAPGQYDIYWSQGLDHLDKPLLLAAGVNVEENRITTIRADSGVKLNAASWVPRFRSYGEWGAVPTGQPYNKDKKTNWTDSIEPLLLPAGKYDIYWIQGLTQQDAPMLFAAGVTVQGGQLVTVAADAGIKLSVAAWVPQFRFYGEWGVVPTGQPYANGKKTNWTDSIEPLLLSAGKYDVYWTQDLDHQSNPMLLAAGVTVQQGQLVTVAADAGIKLQLAPWVPPLGSYGEWGAAPSGQPYDKKINWTNQDDQILLPPGQYDVYRVQDLDHRSNPMLLARNVTVTQGKLVTVSGTSGIRLQLSPGAPALDPNYGVWGVVRAGGDPGQLINWSKGDTNYALLVPQGTYDIVWQQDLNHQRVKLQQNVTVPEGKLVEVPVQPPR